MPRLTGLRINDAKKLLDREKIDYQIFNEENSIYVVQQVPQPGVQFGIQNKVSLYCSDEKTVSQNIDDIEYDMTMPNLVGMSLRQAITLSKVLKINLFIDGTGHVVSQSIRAGERLNYQQRCTVVAR